MRRHRGLTAIELMVAMTLSLSVLGVLSAFLVMTLRSSAQGTVQVAMEQDLMLAMNQLQVDLQTTGGRGITISPSDGTTAPVTVAIVPLYRVGADGTQLWSQNVVLYQWSGAGGSLNRSVVNTSEVNGTEPMAIPTADLTTLTSTSPVTLVTDVQSFSIQATQAAVAETVTASITLSRQAAVGNKANTKTFQDTITVSVRN